jgi:site-specific recombinase XerD
MASIYKKGRDKRKKCCPYYIDYVDQQGKRRTIKGFTDKEKTRLLANKKEEEVRLRVAGLIDPDLETLAEARNAEVNELVDRFEEHLKRKGGTAKYVAKILFRIREILKETKCRKLKELSREKVEQALARLQSNNNLANRTLNHYIQSIEQWETWLVNTGRKATHSLKGVTRKNNQIDIRRKRRALTEEEFSQLCSAALLSEKVVQGYSGSQRRDIYEFAFLTGFRKNELASLTPRSFQLGIECETVTIEASISKHRRKDVVPLHPYLAGKVREMAQYIPPDQPLFPKLASRKTWLMVKTDLNIAGIEYVNHEGYADFHAAGRHTFITTILKKGASLPEARKLARHAEIRMTMNYTHIGHEEQAKALAKLQPPSTIGKNTTCQRIVSNSGDSSGQQDAHSDITCLSNEIIEPDANPTTISLYDAPRQKKALSAESALKWRRGELNPRPVNPKSWPLRV